MVAVALATPPPPPVAALVVLDDRARLRLESSRQTFRVGARGTVTLDVEVVNHGEDPHDVTLRRVGSLRPLATSGVLQPSEPTARPGTMQQRLRVGRYVLYCSVGAGTSRSHEARGMVQRITVVRRLRGR